MNRLTRWQLLKKMRDHFWERWSREYLQALIPKPKWWTANEQIQVGRLCLIRGEHTPPLADRSPESSNCSQAKTATSE